MADIQEWMKTVEEKAQEVATSENCLLYDIEFVGAGSGRTLRVFIDKEEEGAISIDDCSNVSKGISDYLDTNDVIPGDTYNLEVSTPGLDRVLKQPWHFKKAIGKKVYIKTTKALETLGVTDRKWKSAKTVEEVLEAADDNGLHFKVGGVDLDIPYAMIDKAKIVFEFSKGQKK